MKNRTGIIRSHRRPKNLLDHPFKVDQRSYWENLGYISAYLKHINYFNINNTLEGKWSQLISGDPIIFMAAIVNDPISDLIKDLDSYDSSKVTHERKVEIADKLVKWYDKIIYWEKSLFRLDENKLALQLKSISRDILEPQKKALDDFKYKRIISSISIPFLGPFLLTNSTTQDKDDPISNALHIFIKVIERLQNTTRKFLEEDLFSRGNHQAHTAMYVAFTFLYKTVQDQLNKLPKKHLDFYYKDILQQNLEEAQQSRTVLNFNLLPDANDAYIEKGTKVSAGKLFGSQSEVLFETKKTFVAQQITIEEMQTLVFNYNPYIKIGTDKTTIYSVEKKHLIREGKETEQKEDWYVFGASKKSIKNTKIKAKRKSTLGFIIGSPVLILSEGKREIDLKLTFESLTANNTLWLLLNQIKENRNISMDTVFNKVFYDGFKISYTSKEGWLDFENYSIIYSEENSFITIRLILQNFEPALENSNKIEESLQWPSIKVVLNDYASIYLYSFFKGVEIKNIEINVDVENLRNLTIFNNVGKMSLDKPFEVFGPLAAKGSYLLIGKSELFQKDIKSLDIKLDWDNIPTVMGGFDTYYEGYNNTIGNESFKADFSLLTKGYWSPTEDKQTEYNLFNTKKCLSPEGYESLQLSRSSRFHIGDIKDLDIGKDYDLKDPMPYTGFSQSGFLKLNFSAPDFGFGTDIYQQEFTAIATFNAKNKLQLPFPNKPYIPKLKEVSVSYTASDKLMFQDDNEKSTAGSKNIGELYHIMPSGTDEIFNKGKVKKYTLLPDYEKRGNFYLALKGVLKNVTISLFFHFLRSGSTINIVKKELTWEYFEMGKWMKLDNKKDIIKDGTNGFVKTGIVEIQLPKIKRIDKNKKDELYWIRVSTDSLVEHYPKIKGVYINALEAVCISDDPLVKGKNIPRGSINKLMAKIPNVKNVNQPATSFAGKRAEDEDHLYTRVSERLKHKSRAVTMWDYEVILLEMFDTVRIAKCTNLNNKFEAVPGQLTIAVLSMRWTHTERDYFKQNTLDVMKRVLKKYTNPFVFLKVINPIAEYLLVNCTVTFKEEYADGLYIWQLNEEISNFLSPVIASDMGVKGIGGKVYPLVVKNYIEKLDYVDTVEHLVIEQIISLPNYEYELKVVTEDNSMGQPICASTPWSILVPARQHRIRPVNKNKDGQAVPLVGYGDMEIDIDFVLEGEIPSKRI